MTVKEVTGTAKKNDGKSVIAEGYCRSDAGVIPCDWIVKSIGDTLRLDNGFAFKPKDWTDRGLPIIRIQNLNDVESSFNYYNAALPDRYHVANGDLLFAWSGTTGTSFGARIWAGSDGVLNQHIFKVTPDKKVLTKQYAFLVLQRVQDAITKQAHGFKSSFVHVKKSDLVGVPLPIPPLPEQRAIAAALSDVDELIGALDKLIAKKRAIKLATMQQLLTGKTRLPGFSGEWAMLQVHEFGQVVTGGTPPTTIDAFWGDGFPWVTPTDISSQRCIETTERSITRSGLDKLRPLPANAVLVTCIASIGKNAILKTPGACNQQINAVIPGADHDSDFLYYLFEASAGYLKSKAGITATSILSKASFAELEFLVPSKQEQVAIGAVLVDMDAEIAALEQRRDKTKAIKQGMMQSLLTGRVRLVEPEGTP